MTAIRTSNARVEHYDSTAGDPKTQAIADNIGKVLNQASADNPNLPRERIYSEMTVLIQRGPECGIHAIENAKAVTSLEGKKQVVILVTPNTSAWPEELRFNT